MAETAHVGPGTGSDATGGSQGGGGAQDKAQQVVGDAKEQVKEQAGQVKDQAQQQAQQVKEQAGGRLKSEVDRRSTEAGERVKSQAHDLRSVSEQLREQGKDGPAKVADQVAERVERVGGYLHESDGERILDDVEDFARRNPWAVVAGGVVLGIVASRLLKASSVERSQRRAHERPAVRPPGAARPAGTTTATASAAASARPPGTPDPAVHRRRRPRVWRRDTGHGARPRHAHAGAAGASTARTTRCAARRPLMAEQWAPAARPTRKADRGALQGPLRGDVTLIRQEMALAGGAEREGQGGREGRRAARRRRRRRPLAAGALTAAIIAAAGQGDGHVARRADRRRRLRRGRRRPRPARQEDSSRRRPPVPEQTVDSVKEDVAWAKTRARSAAK